MTISACIVLKIHVSCNHVVLILHFVCHYFVKGGRYVIAQIFVTVKIVIIEGRGVGVS